MEGLASTACSSTPTPMPTPLFAITPILCLLAFFLGVIAARWVLERKHLGDRLRIEEEMMRKVRSRFEAYLRLEAQVMRIFRRLDEIESETSKSLAATDERLRTLHHAMSAHENGRVDRAAMEQAGLGWMHAFLEEAPQSAPKSAPPAVRPVQEQRDEAAAEADAIAEWEGKLEHLRAEKHAEIERQGALIAELTERLRRLEPKNERTDLTKRLEKEMLFWQEKHQRLERENAVEIATLRAQVELDKGLGKKLTESEQRLEQLAAERAALAAEKQAVIAGLEARVAELEPNVAALEHVRAEVRHWQKRCDEEVARRESEISDLRERVDELEPMESTIEFLWEDKAVLERTISAKDRDLESAGTLRKQQMLELTAAREALADLESSHRELTMRYAAETLELHSKLQALEPLSMRLEDASARMGELEQSLAFEHARAAELEEEVGLQRRRAEEHETAADRWRVESEDAGRQLAQWQERHQRLESDTAAEILSLQSHIATLEPLVARVTNFEKLVVQLETAERAGRQRITELEVEARRLTRELESRGVKHDRTAERLADVERSLVESTVRLRQAEERHAAELTELRNRLQGYATELANAQKAQSELAGRNRDQEAALRDLENQLGDSRTRGEELERRMSLLDQEAQGKTRRISSLMAELDTASHESERVRREADRKRSLVEAAESVLAELRPKLQALEAQLHEKDGGFLEGDDRSS
jgi:chromosome segregation ATPase